MSDSKAADEAVLSYAGKNGAHLLGVPARDLTSADVSRLTGGRLGKTRPTVVKRLVESGLYTEAASASAADEKADEKE